MLAGLTGMEWVFCGSLAFLAGCVRGFAGFGLSALAMTCLVLILPLIELNPIFYVLEGTASLAMFRGGVRYSDMSHVWPLASWSICCGGSPHSCHSPRVQNRHMIKLTVADGTDFRCACANVGFQLRGKKDDGPS